MARPSKQAKRLARIGRAAARYELSGVRIGARLLARSMGKQEVRALRAKMTKE